MTDVAVPEIARRAAQTLADAVASPLTVILLGSHCHGTAGPDSDLDLLVIKDVVASAYDETVRLRRALRGLPVPVDLVVVSREEAARPRSTVVIEAMREGVVLIDHAAE